MSDTEENSDPDAGLKQRHRKERKELQAEIQKLKSSVSKGDRKKKKEVNEKIAVMEAELDARHEKELADLKPNSSECKDAEKDVEQMTEAIGQLQTDNQNEVTVQPTQRTKASKAQKRREKKAAANQERESRIKEQEIENLTSSRHLEAVTIKTWLSQRGLKIFEVPSDGDCLYAAISHQLKQKNMTISVSSLRSQVAEYMRSNCGDFMPFLTREDGDCYTEEDYEKYCIELESTPAWGGQLEIQALSNVLKTPVEVVQSEGPPIVTGEQFKGPPLVLTYYRHAFGLGQHYNSVQTRTDDDNEDEPT